MGWRGREGTRGDGRGAICVGAHEMAVTMRVEVVCHQSWRRGAGRGRQGGVRGREGRQGPPPPHVPPPTALVLVSLALAIQRDALCVRRAALCGARTLNGLTGAGRGCGAARTTRPPGRGNHGRHPARRGGVAREPFGRVLWRTNGGRKGGGAARAALCAPHGTQHWPEVPAIPGDLALQIDFCGTLD
ncbi:hypothetical protein E2C01_059952 [Portunus trituberculatus]|uniref:Uncharacterized protein n=1 Tax=Portunus trituberculatus TaxID=210409 RepID=A0A5B7H802_PORTR|nr:hypothetical protein [Portunus trituberculatus]